MMCNDSKIEKLLINICFDQFNIHVRDRDRVIILIFKVRKFLLPYRNRKSADALSVEPITPVLLRHFDRLTLRVGECAGPKPVFL